MAKADQNSVTACEMRAYLRVGQMCENARIFQTQKKNARKMRINASGRNMAK
jgi:hypothetical protein